MLGAKMEHAKEKAIQEPQVLYLIKRRRTGASAYSLVLLEGIEQKARWGSASDFYTNHPLVFTSKEAAESLMAKMQADDPHHEYKLRCESWRWWL